MSSPPTYAVALAQTILDHAVACGLDPDALLRDAGLNQGLSTIPGARIGARELLRLCRACDRLGGGPKFGCELSYRLATNGVQGLNILMDSAPTLGASLDCLAEFLPLLASHGRCERTAQGGSIRFSLLSRGAGSHHYCLDAALLALLRNLAQRVGMAPSELFEEVLLTPRQACDEQLDRWAVAWRRASAPGFRIRQEALALRQLKADELFHRTLRRRWEGLRDGTSAQEPDDGLQQARLWLRSSDQSIELIAGRAGYSQPGNFIRAFRKRFGVTPKQYRLKD